MLISFAWPLLFLYLLIANWRDRKYVKTSVERVVYSIILLLLLGASFGIDSFTLIGRDQFSGSWPRTLAIASVVFAVCLATIYCYIAWMQRDDAWHIFQVAFAILVLSSLGFIGCATTLNGALDSSAGYEIRGEIVKASNINQGNRIRDLTITSGSKRLYLQVRGRGYDSCPVGAQAVIFAKGLMANLPIVFLSLTK